MSHELAAALRQQHAALAHLRDAGPEAWAEWHEGTLPLIAGLRGAEDLLDRFMALSFDQEPLADLDRAAQILQEAVALAEREALTTAAAPQEEGLVGPCPAAPGGIAAPSALAQALELIHFSAAPPEAKATAQKALQDLRREMEKLDPDWQVVRPAVIALAEFGEELFFTALAWAVQQRRQMG